LLLPLFIPIGFKKFTLIYSLYKYLLDSCDGSMPNEWYHTLQAQSSIKSVVNFQKDKFIVNGKCIDPSQLSNKFLSRFAIFLY
jgi:hypothetical protein